MTTTYWKIHSSVEDNFTPEERKAKVYANGNRYFLNKTVGEQITAELNQGSAHKAAGLDQPEGLQGTYALHSRTISDKGVYQDGDEAAAELNPPAAAPVFAPEPPRELPPVSEFTARSERATDPTAEPAGTH